MPQSPAFLVTVLVLNLVTDVCIILIPIPIILPLKISWARKLGLLGMFCAGIFIMIAAILRVYFVMAVSTVSIYLTTNASLIPQTAPTSRNSSHLVVPRRHCRRPGWTGHHPPAPLHPSVLVRLL